MVIYLLELCWKNVCNLNLELFDCILLLGDDCSCSNSMDLVNGFFYGAD